MFDKKTSEIDEDKLWVKYKETKEPKIRDILIKKYAPLVKYVAGKLAIGMPSGVEFDDLVGYGTFGLFDAIEKFDPKKNVKFKTYAVTRIKGSIYDELRSIDWVPRMVRQKMKEIDSATKNLEMILGRNPTNNEIAKELGVSLAEFNKTTSQISRTSLVSLNESRSAGEEDDKSSIENMVEGSKTLNPDFIIEDKETKRILAKFIKELPEKEYNVLHFYYYEDLTLKEIGATLGVTESRVSQLHGKAIEKLRVKLKSFKKGII